MTVKPMVRLLAMLLVATAPARAQRFMYAGVPDTAVLAFLGKLQKAVGAGDRAAVAGMVRYPLRVNRDAAQHTSIASAADLMKQYDAVFTPTIRQAITKQVPAKLIGGKEGVAIDAGRLWISGICDKHRPPKCVVGIISVNLHGEK